MSFATHLEVGRGSSGQESQIPLPNEGGQEGRTALRAFWRRDQRKSHPIVMGGPNVLTLIT